MKSETYRTEAVFNVYDSTPIWYDIPGFPGYQVSFLYGTYVRSFKRYKVYPFGTLIKYNTTNNCYTLTNDNNQSIKLSIQEIHELVNDNKIIPVATNCVITKGRNNRMSIIPDANTSVGKIVSKPRELRKDGEKLSFADFSHLK